MSLAGGALLAGYFLVLGGLALLGLHRLYLTLLRPPGGRVRPPTPNPLPPVTVQLPVFNEIHVLDRLVAAACALRYPRDRMEIQILDDSTDATSRRAAELAEIWRSRGHDVTCLHRADRAGYKAGALAAGLARSRGELVAIFDADFIPPPGFLERAVPWFREPRVGMVQARWGHLNRATSLLTRAQALILDAHFGVEQAARHASGRCFNFNGTAGIFRRRCIDEAGGWQQDTLTEDLDLSYRAQVAGWKFVYLDDLACPAELPVEINALRSQQHRWAKGSIQTALKLLPSLMRSPLRPAVKAEAAFHLLNNLAYLLLFAASLLVIPSLALRSGLGWRSPLADLGIFVAGTCSFGLYAVAAQMRLGRGAWKALAELPVAMALGAGLALTNAMAVVEALLGRTSEFRRTPKLGIVDREEKWPGREEDGGSPAPGKAPLRERGDALPYRGEPSRLAPFELALSVTFAVAIAWACRAGLYASIPFLALFGAGYGYVATLTLLQQRRGARPVPAPRGAPAATLTS